MVTVTVSSVTVGGIPSVSVAVTAVMSTTVMTRGTVMRIAMVWLGVDNMVGLSVIYWLVVNYLMSWMHHHWLTWVHHRLAWVHHWLLHGHLTGMALLHWHSSLRVSVTSWLHSFDFINYKNFNLHSN